MSGRAQVLFQVGARAWVVTGIGHLAITALLLGRPASPAAETAVLGAMRAHRMTMMGLSRDLLGLFRGFSVAMGLVLALHGAVCALAALAALPAVVALNAAVSLAAARPPRALQAAQAPHAALAAVDAHGWSRARTASLWRRSGLLNRWIGARPASRVGGSRRVHRPRWVSRFGFVQNRRWPSPRAAETSYLRALSAA
ncbi:LIC_13387 family protein [Sorangium sp. So ce448]|uniref:LIC_13387 family protein n=1 Tax=Sorangium sp. So ce448 TaxID=3133314 RepID=UPI003F645597